MQRNSRRRQNVARHDVVGVVGPDVANVTSLFTPDVDSFVTFIRNCCEGKIFSFELVKKLETVDNRIINENGFK